MVENLAYYSKIEYNIAKYFSVTRKVREKMQYSAQRQSGSVIVYTIVGVLLAAAAVGAIIVAQNRGNQQIASRPITEAPQAPEDNSESEAQSDKQSEEAKQQQAQKEAAEKKAAEDKAKADAVAKQQADEKKAAEAAQQQAAAAAASPMARTGGAAQSAGNLPTTGPVEDTLSMVIGLTAILGAGYLYYHFGRRG